MRSPLQHRWIEGLLPTICYTEHTRFAFTQGGGLWRIDLSNEHTIRGMKPSSKSLSKRRPSARAYHHRNQLIDVVTRLPQCRRPNAQKHGVFSACPTIPGEDPREFVELHSDLIDEWQPSGPTEEDAVFSLADLMWRKIRAQKMLRAKLSMNTYDLRHPLFDQRRGFDFFIGLLLSEPETAFEQHASYLLKADSIGHLKKKFPRSNYRSTSDWVEAVIAEIKSVLMPAAPHSLSATEPMEGDLPEPFRRWVIDCQVGVSIDLEKKSFQDELNLRERLEAMIDRKVKHLIQLKAMKQMLRQTGAMRDDEQPKRITAKRGLQ